MPRLITMGDLITRCKARADKSSDDHVTEWRSLISEVYAADVFSVVADTGFRYFETIASLVTTGADYVSEPTNHLSTVRLDYIDASTGRRNGELKPLNVDQEGKRIATSGADRAYEYAAVDDRIYLYPPPPTGQTYELLYIPQPPDLNAFADDQCVDVVTPDGEACLIWGFAAIAKAKAVQGLEYYELRAERHRKRLMEWAAERSMSQTQQRASEIADDDFYPPGMR